MILLVEDDESLGHQLSLLISGEGYKVNWKKSLTEARAFVESKPDLIILDWMLPDGQGIDFLLELRRRGLQIPVILLTARSELIDRVLGLEGGANDYVTKPFEPRELVARIRVQLRNLSSNQNLAPKTLLQFQNITIDISERRVNQSGRDIALTKMEFELLVFLAKSPNKPFTRDELLDQVWGFENFPTSRTVDTHVLQLRQKLGDGWVETIRGVGYAFRTK